MGKHAEYEDCHVLISQILIHPEIEDISINTSISVLHDWSTESIKCRLIAYPIICIIDDEKEDRFLVIENINTFKICKLALPQSSEIIIRIVPNDAAGFFLTSEVVINPSLLFRKAREIGSNFRILKKTHLKKNLCEFGPCFSSQNNISRALGYTKSSVFYPSQKSMKNTQKENSNIQKTGDEVPLKNLVKSRRKRSD